MFETIVAFLAGFLLTWPALIALFCIGVGFEYAEWRGFAVFTALITALTSYFYFHVPFLDILVYAAGYLVIGLLWSFWRYKRYVDKKIKDWREVRKGAGGGKDYIIEKLKPSNMWPTITAWVFVWPFSAVENLVGDIIDIGVRVVKQVFRGVYNRIYLSAIKSILPSKPAAD
jgi:hypothetical protein